MFFGLARRTGPLVAVRAYERHVQSRDRGPPAIEAFFAPPGPMRPVGVSAGGAMYAVPQHSEISAANYLGRLDGSAEGPRWLPTPKQAAAETWPNYGIANSPAPSRAAMALSSAPYENEWSAGTEGMRASYAPSRPVARPIGGTRIDSRFGTPVENEGWIESAITDSFDRSERWPADAEVADGLERLAEPRLSNFPTVVQAMGPRHSGEGVGSVTLAAQESFDSAQERAMAERLESVTGRDSDAIYREMNGEPNQGPTVLSPLHSELVSAGRRFRPSPNTRGWTTPDAVAYQLGRNIFPFKDQWVRGHRAAILAAARRFDLPPALLAGVAYNEVGGDPLWLDRAAYALRRGEAADRTSFGDLSIQLRTALDALGYRSAGPWQRRAIIASLTDPATSIFIAARVLSDLREREFRGISGRRLTREQVEVLGARYNRGPSVSRRRLNLDYGRVITKRWRHLNNLLSGR